MRVSLQSLIITAVFLVPVFASLGSQIVEFGLYDFLNHLGQALAVESLGPTVLVQAS